jgi:hypothetical protein
MPLSADVLDFVRQALLAQPLTPATVDHAMEEARRVYGGETVYIRTPPRLKVSRRAQQLQHRRHCHE